MRIRAPLVAFALISSVGIRTHAASPENLALLADYSAVAFSEVTSVTVAQLADPNGAIASPTTKAAPAAIGGDFHGCTLISKWSEVTDQARAGLVELLKRPIDFWVKAYASAGDQDLVGNMGFCMPDYGYALHLETSHGPRDFLICLRCGQISAFGGDHRVLFGLHDADLVDLKAYYLDEFVLGTGVKRHR